MTIDKVIPKLQFVRNALNDDMEIAKAYDVAISTMHKHQKIQKIVNKWHHDIEAKDYECMAEIAEVIEDDD